VADEKPEVGSIGWHDLTVENAEEVRDFYEQVIGWTSSPVDMKGYSDFSMVTPGGQTVAGVCHARGSNANLPPQWLLYFVVADVDKSAGTCKEQGGHILVAPSPLAGGRFCVIKDPAGAVCALYQP